MGPNGRKKTGNVEPHAGTTERMCITSPTDIRVNKINACRFAVFVLSNNYVLFSVSVKKVLIS